MSKQDYADDSAEHWPSPPNVFLFADRPRHLGCSPTGSPILAMSDDHEYLATSAIGVQRWSGGTDAC